jgi:hypothetical protein
VSLIGLIRDACSRIVAAREAFEVGDTGLAYEILTDLEHDIAAGLAAIGDDEPRVGLADLHDIPSYDRGDERIAAWCRAYLDNAA